MVHCRCLWALAQLLVARLELVGENGVPRLISGGRGVESGMFPRGRSFFCFKNGGAFFFSVTRTARGRDEVDTVKKE